MRLLLQHPPTAFAEWAIAARRAGEDFVRNQEAGGNSNNGSTAHPTPPEIPLRLRRALSGKPESSTALRMTRAATQKLSLRGIKIGTALIAVPNEGSKNFCRESFEGVQGGLFQKSPLHTASFPTTAHCDRRAVPADTARCLFRANTFPDGFMRLLL